MTHSKVDIHWGSDTTEFICGDTVDSADSPRPSRDFGPGLKRSTAAVGTVQRRSGACHCVGWVGAPGCPSPALDRHVSRGPAEAPTPAGRRWAVRKLVIARPAMRPLSSEAWPGGLCLAVPARKRDRAGWFSAMQPTSAAQRWNRAAWWRARGGEVCTGVRQRVPGERLGQRRPEGCAVL